MKLSPQSTAGGSGELFPPCPKYIVQSQWPNGRKVLGYFRKLHTFRPGQLVAVGYMDRENTPGRDAQFYYTLLSEC